MALDRGAATCSPCPCGHRATALWKSRRESRATALPDRPAGFSARADASGIGPNIRSLSFDRINWTGLGERNPQLHQACRTIATARGGQSALRRIIARSRQIGDDIASRVNRATSCGCLEVPVLRITETN